MSDRLLRTGTFDLPYTEEESGRACREWKAMCGHHSIAVACGVGLEAVRKACPKLCGWMNPTMIGQTLQGLGRTYKLVQEKDSPEMKDHPVVAFSCAAAVIRMQFEGPWERTIKGAYRHTHYIAVRDLHVVVDPMVDPNEWMTVEWWLHIADEVVKEGVPGSTGWRFTHVWVIQPEAKQP